MEKDERIERGEVLPVLKGEEMSNGLHLGLLLKILRLSKEEGIRFIRATLADVDRSLGRPPWAESGPAI
jgi:hypothetical protein